MSPTALFTWAMSVSSHGTCAPAPVPAADPVSLPHSRCTCTTLESPPCLALPPSRSPCQRISPEAGTLRGKPEKALSFEMLVARLPRVPSVEVRSSYQVRAEGGKEGGRARGREGKREGEKEGGQEGGRKRVFSKRYCITDLLLRHT